MPDPPPLGSVVMGTGIVAIALHLDGRETLSSIALGLACAAWLLLAASVATGLATARGQLAHQAREPRALTIVAGTCVLGSAMAQRGWDPAGLALLAVGAALWCALLPAVGRRRAAGPSGFWFLLAVSTQSLAALAATLAGHEGQRWMALAALALVGLGIVLYPVGLSRFPLSELRRGGGEIWIAGGALAIGALACGELVRATEALALLEDGRETLEGLDLALWAAAAAWLPVLLAAELRWPRPGYTSVRWATVFPVGMYAASSFRTGELQGIATITDFARVWVWVALAVWCLAALGLTREAARRLRPSRGRAGSAPRS